MEVFYFLLPTAAICMLLLWDEWQAGYGKFSSNSEHCSAYFSLLSAALGTFVIFLVPYLLTNSLGDFVEGVFILPRKRFENASMNFRSHIHPCC